MSQQQNVAALEARAVELEVKVAYQEETIAALHDVVVELQGRVGSLEDNLRRVEEALRRLATKAPAQPVLGAHPEHDPVPHSG
jgi:uncharacterized coiled-coil protein SlyX